jgi:CPA1 family monovalent cation:H+ antiporter
LDKKTFWSVKKPILNLSVALVFLTVISVGYLVNALFPVISLAAAFILISSLGPTDDVAVASVTKRIKMPGKVMNILQGESMLNDVSGIVSFQFALTAILTGGFSLISAGTSFIIIGLGGILAGLVLTAIKYSIVKWIRSLGMENASLHILIELLTPFLIYMAAEYLGVSAVLAVFTAGIAHSFSKDKINPETIELKIAADSVWDTVSFTLDGFVFLILGMQFPNIIKTMWTDSYSISNTKIIYFVLLLTAVFAVSRFLWAFFTISKKDLNDKDQKISKAKASLIISLSGARGAVTLASVMSIPVLLPNGNPFPERSLIILVSAGIIICSLFIANFILPVLVEKKTAQNESSDEVRAYLNILSNVTLILNKKFAAENNSAANIVMRNYYERINDLRDKLDFPDFNNDEAERSIKLLAFEWERENISNLLNRKEIDSKTARHYNYVLDIQTKKLLGKKISRLKIITGFLKHIFSFKYKKSGSRHSKEKFLFLLERNSIFAADKLRIMLENEEDIVKRRIINKVISDIEMSVFIIKERSDGIRHKEVENRDLTAMFSLAFQIERDCIHEAYEAGSISAKSAKRMRSNLSIIEAQMKKDDKYEYI